MKRLIKLFSKNSKKTIDDHLGETAQIAKVKVSPLCSRMPADLTLEEQKYYKQIKDKVVSYALTQEEKDNLGMEAYSTPKQAEIIRVQPSGTYKNSRVEEPKDDSLNKMLKTHIGYM